LILDNTKQEYDAIAHPPCLGLAGGIVPLDLSDEDVLPTLEKLCNVALNIYNENNNKQVGSILT